jgi:Rrf2 family protein
VVFLASLPRGATVTKYDIAEAEGISPAYVEQLMLPLRLAGLVASHRGRSGGFSLAKDPEAISMADVLRAVEGTVQVAPCDDPNVCSRADACPTRPLWQQASDILQDLFTRTKVADLVRPNSGEAEP